MKIAVFTKNRTNPAYTAARLGADRAASAFGARTLHYVPDIPDHVGEQIALIDQALAEAPDIVVLSPVHSTAVDEAILRIHRAGIPIVGLVTPIECVPVVSFVNADDFSLGRAIAMRLFEHLEGSGDVLVVGGHDHSFTSRERLRGFHEAAAGFQDIRLVGEVAGDYVRDAARVRTAAWLADYPGPVDACLVANDIMALGVLEALRAAGRNAAVVGVNAIPEAIGPIRRGELLASADFSAMRMAYLAAECAVRHLRGETVPRHIELPVQIVDRANCDQWDRPYEERSCWTLAQALEEIRRTGTGKAEWPVTAEPGTGSGAGST